MSGEVKAPSTLPAFLSLFTSTGTLICCALPALLVSIGAGAVMAGLIEAVPQIHLARQEQGAGLLYRSRDDRGGRSLAMACTFAALPSRPGSGTRLHTGAPDQLDRLVDQRWRIRDRRILCVFRSELAGLKQTGPPARRAFTYSASNSPRQAEMVSAVSSWVKKVFSCQSSSIRYSKDVWSIVYSDWLPDCSIRE